MKSRRIFTKIQLIILLLHFIFVPFAQALINQPDEESLRAAMVIGILRYTQLPLTDNDREIEVCTVGSPFVEAKLSSVISGLRVNRKQLRLTKYEKSIDDTVKCHVIISGENTNQKLFENYLSASLQKQLIVCDGCASGLSFSSIEIYKRNNGIGFKVNLKQAKDNNVVFSSSLLELAGEIKGK
ncbi:YfiR family protein [Catenovulum sp. 2E275]|uniref:YfiR family protein n=1 Tax=Catenovulum sp. 2E275 TaxID=2980497 RepID=UPI0021D09331|nr:YfiR family protein [Catenovulum sp. 2E275]MCU4676009.1 YfiR family protein [Catenovulum sp. 2E275]